MRRDAVGRSGVVWRVVARAVWVRAAVGHAVGCTMATRGGGAIPLRRRPFDSSERRRLVERVVWWRRPVRVARELRNPFYWADETESALDEALHLMARRRRRPYVVRRLPYAHHPSGCVHGIFRKGDDSVPLFVATRSAAMARLSGVDKSALGLYAGKPYARGVTIGRYSGRVLGEFESLEAAEASPELARAAQTPGPNCLLVRTRSPYDGTFELIDGRDAPAPFFQLINDTRGTGLPLNVWYDHDGSARTLRAVTAFDFDQPLAHNAASELLVDYGDTYWEEEEGGQKGPA